MPDIRIDPASYLTGYSHWDMLVRYLNDCAERYSYDTASSKEETFRFLKDLTAASFKGAITFDRHDAGNLLTRGLEELAREESLILGRDNLLRLILALGINELHNGNSSTAIQEANHFLLNYMHDVELSARNLQECIFIWGLHKNLSTRDIVTMIHRYREEIKKQPLHPSAEDLYEGGTSEVLNLLGQVQTRQQFDAFIEEHKYFFTKLGNTHYCSLFNDVTIFPYTRRDGVKMYILLEYEEASSPKSDLIQAFLEERSQSDIVQRQNYYMRLFGLYSIDEEEFDNHLDRKTIGKLTKVLPDVFMTMDRFTNLIRRKTGADVPYGVHILHMLIDLLPQSYVPVDAVKTDPDTGKKTVIDPLDAFANTCNAYLNNVGFASLNRMVPIDRLILDVYSLTIRERNGEEYKDLFLHNFRKALQEIADTAA